MGKFSQMYEINFVGIEMDGNNKTVLDKVVIT